MQGHRHEHPFSDVHDKQELQIKYYSKGKPHSNSNERGGTVSQGEFIEITLGEYKIFLYGGKREKCWVPSH